MKILIFFLILIIILALKYFITKKIRRIQIIFGLKDLLKGMESSSNRLVESERFNLKTYGNMKECFYFIIGFYYDNQFFFNSDVHNKIKDVGYKLGLHPDNWNLMNDIFDNKDNFTE